LGEIIFRAYAKAVDDATEKVYGMVRNLAEAFKVIDKELVRK